jgi:hypothetical protein
MRAAIPTRFRWLRQVVRASAACLGQCNGAGCDLTGFAQFPNRKRASGFNQPAQRSERYCADEGIEQQGLVLPCLWRLVCGTEARQGRAEIVRGARRACLGECGGDEIDAQRAFVDRALPGQFDPPKPAIGKFCDDVARAIRKNDIGRH